MTASFALLILALWGIGREVWVARVLHNAPALTNISGVVSFYLAAFADTRHVVQVLALAVLAAFIWFIYSSVKTLRTTMPQQVSLGSA